MAAPVIWPFPANAGRAVERYGYMTAVAVARDKTEQRSALRLHPIGGIDFDFTAYRQTDAWNASVPDRTILLSLVQSNAGGKWLVPLWPYGCTLTNDISAGATTLPTSLTTYSPFRTASGVGTYALVFRRPGLCEAVEMNIVSSNSLTLVTGTAKAWRIGDRVVPCRVGWLRGVVEIPNVSSEIVAGRIAFEFDSNNEGTALGAPSDFIIGPGMGVVIPGG